MLTGESSDDLLVPLRAFLRGLAFGTVRVADVGVRNGVCKAILTIYDEMVQVEFMPRTAFVLISSNIVIPMIDALCAQLEHIRANESQLAAAPSRFWLPNILCLFDASDSMAPAASITPCPPAWRVLKSNVATFRSGVKEYHPNQGCKAWFWFTHMSAPGAYYGTQKPMFLDSRFEPNAYLIPSTSVLCRQRTMLSNGMTFDSQMTPTGETELYTFVPKEYTFFESQKSYTTGEPATTDFTEDDWLIPHPQSLGFAADPILPASCSPTAGTWASAGPHSPAGPSAPGSTPLKNKGVPLVAPVAPIVPPGRTRAAAAAAKPPKKRARAAKKAADPNAATKSDVESPSLLAVIAVERELQAHGLHSWESHKRSMKAKQGLKKKPSDTYNDEVEMTTEPIHMSEAPGNKIVPMPGTWCPDGGWAKAIEGKIMICQGDFNQYLFPDLIDQDTVYPGEMSNVRSGAPSRVHAGCHKGDACRSRHHAEATAGGPPWTESQQMNLCAIRRIHGLLAPEFAATFKSQSAIDYECHLVGSDKATAAELAVGFESTDRTYTDLGSGAASPAPEAYTSDSAIAIDAIAY